MALDTKHSVVDLLKSQGKDSSFSARKALAEEAGIKNYIGSYDQNVSLYNYVSNTGGSSKGTPKTNNIPVVNIPKVNQSWSLLDDREETLNVFAPSSNVTGMGDDAKNKQNKYTEHSNVDSIVDDGTKDIINSTFTEPTASAKAMNWIQANLSKIQSGKTSYSDDVRAMVEKIQNREKFSYDVDNDQLFQQALASAMGSGKQAMQDTIGQASSLTGGYGSTYATSAGNQAYNAFIEDAYNNLPQYYQMAFDAYQAEGQDMYQQLAMLSQEDAKEFERMLTAYDVTFDYRNRMYDEAYSAYRDQKSDAFASANLQINEYNAIGDALYNDWYMSKDMYETAYGQEFDAWQSKVDTTLELMRLEEDQRQFDLGYEQDEQFHKDDMTYKYGSLNYEKERDSIEDSRYLAENDFNGDKVVDAKDERDRARYEQGDLNFDGVISDDERAYLNEVNGGKVSGNDNYFSDTEIRGIQNTYRNAGGGEKGVSAVQAYLRGIGKYQETEEFDDMISSYLSSATAEEGLPVWYQTWTLSKDTKNVGVGKDKGDDNNDTYVNLNGESMTFKELKKAVENSPLPEEDKKAFLDELRTQANK